MTVNNTYESDPNAECAEPVEIELTAQQWQIIVGSVALLSHDARDKRASDWKVVVELGRLLEKHRGAKNVIISL
jgi:hypothetical protein